jgi:glyoxalase family protein
VKKTVNQDDVSAYHLFYADAAGSPGSDVTFFDWPYMAAHVPGAGDIAEIALRVPDSGALDWWAQRLDARGIARSEAVDHGGRPSFTFTDPEGQRLRLVDDGGAPWHGVPWATAGIPAAHALQGMDSVMLAVRRLAPTAAVLEQVLNMRRDREVEQGGRRVAVFATGPGGPGAELHVVEMPDAPRARLGAGGVHHVAFRTPDADEQAAWQHRIRSAGLMTSELIDRFYFRSLYFREPNGILFEIATDGPGFAADEDAAHLGERLAPPPFLEPDRAPIEAGLRPLYIQTSPALISKCRGRLHHNTRCQDDRLPQPEAAATVTLSPCQPFSRATR